MTESKSLERDLKPQRPPKHPVIKWIERGKGWSSVRQEARKELVRSKDHRLKGLASRGEDWSRRGQSDLVSRGKTRLSEQVES